MYYSNVLLFPLLLLSWKFWDVAVVLVFFTSSLIITVVWWFRSFLLQTAFCSFLVFLGET